jgi:hypothetical protein
MKKRKQTFNLYKKIYPKARKFAVEQYETDGYERQWLNKGYYHGYVKGALAMRRHIKSLMGKEIADGLLELTLGKPKKIVI